MGIDYLGLTSLQRISNGRVIIALNTRLCYVHNLDMSPIFTNPIQTFVKRLNRNDSECGKCGRGVTEATVHSSCYFYTQDGSASCSQTAIFLLIDFLDIKQMFTGPKENGLN